MSRKSGINHIRRKTPVKRFRAVYLSPQSKRMGTAQNFVTAQFATVWEGSEGTFTAKTGPERVVI
jgi:hypothetical protein